MPVKPILQLLVALMMIVPFPSVLAQKTDTTKGKVKVNQDPRVEILLSKHVLINTKVKGIEGFRIQIFSDSGNNSKTDAQQVYDGFVAKYRDIGVYLTFKSPNYKVRVGDFRTRLEAQRFLNDIAGDYPNAFITSEVINLPKVE